MHVKARGQPCFQLPGTLSTLFCGDSISHWPGPLLFGEWGCAGHFKALVSATLTLGLQVCTSAAGFFVYFLWLVSLRRDRTQSSILVWHLTSRAIPTPLIPWQHHRNPPSTQNQIFKMENQVFFFYYSESFSGPLVEFGENPECTHSFHVSADPASHAIIYYLYYLPSRLMSHYTAFLFLLHTPSLLSLWANATCFVLWWKPSLST